MQPLYPFLPRQSMCRNPPWLCRSAFAPRVTLSILTFNSLLISRCGLPRLSRLMICHRSTTDASSRGVRISFRKPITSVRFFKRVNKSQNSWRWLRFGRCICVMKNKCTGATVHAVFPKVKGKYRETCRSVHGRNYEKNSGGDLSYSFISRAGKRSSVSFVP